MTYRNRVREEIRRRFRWRQPDFQSMIEVGLLGRKDVILPLHLPVDAQCLASLMNAYLSAWRKERRHGSSPHGKPMDPDSEKPTLTHEKAFTIANKRHP